MSYSPATVANYFLAKATHDSRAVTPMQLIKLVYIAHGWHLGWFNEPLIDESVEAWTYGPVIRSLYGNLKKYGKGAVTSPVPALFFARPEAIQGDTAELLDSVWQSYSRFSGIELSAMTHQVGTPWYKTWHDGGGKSHDGVKIPNAEILAHYKSMVEQVKARRNSAS